MKYATDITGRKTAVNELSRVLMAMSEGKLNDRISSRVNGEFSALKEAMNGTVDRLSNLVSDISNSATSVHSSSNEVQTGSLDLSRRTEAQAASLEETASSMEELMSTVTQNAENTSHVTDLATKAAKIAKQGGTVVSAAIEAMSGINESSKKISDIIGVIDEIAFQTNLLALNAAVEAARAGEQGRGFAVVAGEVRNLAQRSSEAAKEIKDLIKESVVKVSDGTRLVNDSGRTFGEIVESIDKVSELMTDINNSAREQTDGINQVNIAVSQMDDATQQNAALVEQSSAASVSMSEQAQKLISQIRFFSVN